MATTNLMHRVDEDAVEQAWREAPAVLDSLVELDPDQPVADQARLVESGIAIWAIVNHVANLLGEEIHENVDASLIVQTSRDYGISVVEAVGAIVYYREHRADIDGWRRRDLALHEARAARGRHVVA